VVYENHAPQDLAELVGISAEQGLWHYQMAGFPHYLRCDDAAHVQRLRQHFLLNLQQAPNLSNSEMARRRFFKAMHDRIN
jgi:hypothetical protein